tara:strand:+ start:790 stop:1032 length:243 start_codon:yes stop_codon:yes gene_type:complete
MEENQREEQLDHIDDDEYLMKCVVDPTKKTFYLYSNEGDTKTVACDTTEQFMNVLELVRATCPEERLVYSDPIASGKNDF